MAEMVESLFQKPTTFFKSSRTREGAAADFSPGSVEIWGKSIDLFGFGFSGGRRASIWI
jgi:hypothetical protein